MLTNPPPVIAWARSTVVFWTEPWMRSCASGLHVGKADPLSEAGLEQAAVMPAQSPIAAVRTAVALVTTGPGHGRSATVPHSNARAVCRNVPVQDTPSADSGGASGDDGANDAPSAIVFYGSPNFDAVAPEDTGAAKTDSGEPSDGGGDAQG